MFKLMVVCTIGVITADMVSDVNLTLVAFMVLGLQILIEVFFTWKTWGMASQTVVDRIKSLKASTL